MHRVWGTWGLTRLWLSLGSRQSGAGAARTLTFPTTVNTKAGLLACVCFSLMTTVMGLELQEGFHRDLF